MSDFYHISVLLQECIDGLNIKPDGIYVDGTLGGAGHSGQISKASSRIVQGARSSDMAETLPDRRNPSA